LKKIKKCTINTDWEHSGYYRIIASRRDLMKFLNAGDKDVENACLNAQPRTLQNLMPHIYKENPHHVPSRKEIERAIRATMIPNYIAPSVFPVLEIAFQGTYLSFLLDDYLKDKDFKELTNVFKSLILNDHLVSVYYDRNKYVLSTFDESAMLFMIMFPSMIYIPVFDEKGQAKCHFNELEPSEQVDLSKGITEFSSLNHRQITIYDTPQPVDTTTKFAPCIQFFESILLSDQNELKIYPYDFDTGLEKRHMIFNGVPTKKLFKQITRFLSQIPIIK
jgi:hypothetical protein